MNKLILIVLISTLCLVSCSKVMVVPKDETVEFTEFLMTALTQLDEFMLGQLEAEKITQEEFNFYLKKREEGVMKYQALADKIGQIEAVYSMLGGLAKAIIPGV